MTPATLIRSVQPNDLQALLDIYAYYVENTVTTYEEQVPDFAEMQRRVNEILQLGMPYLVADVGGHIAGYAYGGAFRNRAGFRYSVEHSIYLAPQYKGMGIGSKLMEVLIKDLETRGIRQLVAVIGDSENTASIKLHKKFGFIHQGILPASGYKFQRWIDTVLMQRPIGEGDKTQPTGDGLKLK